MIQQDIVTGVRFTITATMFALALVLAFFYKGKVQSRVYNHSRYLLIFGCFLVGGQTLIQFICHFREQSPTLGWVVNQAFFIPAILCFNLAETNILRAGHKMKRYVVRALLFFVISHSLLLVGYFTNTLINDEQPWLTMTFGVAALFFCMKIDLAVSLHRNMKQTFAALNDAELNECHKALQYTAQSMRWLIYASMLTPWIGVASLLMFSSLYGIILLLLIYWYIFQFCRFGSNIAEVIQVGDEIEEAALIEEEPKGDFSEEINIQVEQWLAKKLFTDPNITIGLALKQMGLSAPALNYYLEHNTDVDNYRHWLPYLRIEEAKRLMKSHPEYTLQGIAMKCGYSDRSSLSRSFKIQVGMAPMEWIAKQNLAKKM